MFPASRSLLLIACCAALAACSDLTGPDSITPTSASPDMTTMSAPAATNIEFGDFALHIPANVGRVRGILVAFGGPNTRGFAVGSPFGAPPPVEIALQELGTMFRDLAAERGLAILGSSRFGPTAYPDNVASDQSVIAAIAQAASLTGHLELMDAPLLIYGISGGGPEATGFVQRNPQRIVGLFLKVPVTAGPLTGAALEVPAHMVLAAGDVIVNNPALMASFAVHRAAGAPWGMSVEPGVPHHSLSAAQRQFTVNWMRETLARGGAGPFNTNSPHVGWFGDPATGEIGRAHELSGDASAASWFPTRTLAEQWAGFIGW